jgi:peptide/nickel transport system substrate-binding protein
LIVLSVTVATAAEIASSSVKTGGVLRYGLSSEPPTLDPHMNVGAASQTVKNVTYNGLVRYWAGLQIVPDL